MKDTTKTEAGATTPNAEVIEAIHWCIEHGNCGPRTRATLIAARVALLAATTPQADAAIAAGGAQEPVATRAEIEHARDRVIAQSKNSLFRSGAKICAAEILSPTKPCTKPPEGWTCSRIEGHEGPCAASPAASNGEQEVRS